MNKLQGSLIILVCILIGFSQLGSIAAVILSKDINVIRLLFSLFIFILSGFGIKQGINLFRQTKEVPAQSLTPKGQLISKIGSAFIVLSAISALATVGLIIYFSATNATGVPVGFGFAIALVLFVVGQGIKGFAPKNS